MESVMGLAEILKVLKEFRMETAGNFEMIKREINKLRQHTDELKLRMDAVELRIAENEDREAAVTKDQVLNIFFFPARLKVYHPDGKFKVFDNPKPPGRVYVSTVLTKRSLPGSRTWNQRCVQQAGRRTAPRAEKSPQAT